MLNKIFVVFLSVLFSWSALLGGTVGKIVGRVVDAGTGDALIGVNVMIEGTDMGAATDYDGSFIILNIPPGKYDLIFNYVGYSDVKLTGVKVNIDFTTKIEVEMKESVISAEEVVVVAKRDPIRKDQTSSLSVVDNEQIKELPVDNIADVLQVQAGITRDAGGGFHIRGGRSSEINYMVDGVSATDAFDGSVAYDVDKNAVSELQVISGTFNAEYGSAMSGVINVVTKDGGSRLTGQANIYSGGFYTDATDIFYNADNFSFTSMPNIQANISGPVVSDFLTFFVAGRYQKNENYYWGRRVYYPDGSEAPDPENVAMNWFVNGFGQGKLTMKFAPTMKLSYNLIYSYKNWRDYEHAQKLSPDGRLEKFETGINQTLKWDHTLGASTFYTVNFSYFTKEYYHYAYENVVGWQDPQNPGYVDPQSLVGYLPSTNYSFNRGYTDNNRFSRNTSTFISKVDFNHQAGSHHLLKSGLEFRQYSISYKNSTIYNRNNIFPFNPETDYIDPATGQLDEVARNLDPNFSEYSRNPREYAFYIQDKMEYGDFVLNFGLRLDAFDPNSRVPKDKYKYTPDIYKTPFFDKGYITPADEAEFYKDASVKYQFSPRIGVAYSVTAVTKFHFSYGEFLKMPSMNLLYENSNYRIFPASKYGNLVGNPDIKPERTAAYEVGFSTLISNLASANITAFYKDIRDYVGTSNVPVLWENNSATGYGYFYYTNLDYANVRGITLEVNKLYTDNYSLTLDYTFMVSEGTASNPGEYYSADISGEELNRFIFPLDWDQRHTLNGTFYYNFEGWGISFIGTMSSGQPYTPSFATGYPTGLSSIRYYNKNKGRKPNYYNVDMNLKKGFPIGEYNLTFFVRIYNLFDIQNEVNVYTDTGRATFSTAANKARENEIASGNDEDSSFKRWGTFEEYIKQPQMFSAPRQIQLGLTFNF